MIKFDNSKEFDKALEGVIETLDKQIIFILTSAGEKAVAQIRAKSEGIGGRDWMDDTGNLRSSIGFGIVANGAIQTAGGFILKSEGKEGQQEGRKYLDSLAKKYRKGYTLIVVAGMEYATYVADKGYDVLDSGEAIATQLITKLLKEI